MLCGDDDEEAELRLPLSAYAARLFFLLVRFHVHPVRVGWNCVQFVDLLSFIRRAKDLLLTRNS